MIQGLNFFTLQLVHPDHRPVRQDGRHDHHAAQDGGDEERRRQLRPRPGDGRAAHRQGLLPGAHPLRTALQVMNPGL